ncbi:heparinase II/III family protein [Candidatus Sumerlaeota bacterium]|nr:heparinase II/III family protein [Candidatus Sumerlaeota bacterium]
MIYKSLWLLVILFVGLNLVALSNGALPKPIKQSSVFYPRPLIDKALENVKNHKWAKQCQESIMKKSEPWLQCADDEIWSFMFGPSITRAWMVWSDGVCPKCGKDVKMYQWNMDIWKHPFKVICPHCSSIFPTNDFEKFYKSGLNENGIYDSKLADRKLLFNKDHPDTNDPEHLFGVDDGEGYVEGDKRWRFIGYYITKGQWKQKVYGGIHCLSEAYLVTDNPAYARKAAILLDRLADLYPTFDYATQGTVYETGGHRGYVCVWHDACGEAQILAQSFDKIFDAIKKDEALVRFLSEKAKRYKLENPKTNFSLIQENIENRIFRDTLKNGKKIDSNYPAKPVTELTIKTVLEWPHNREEIMNRFAEIIATSTKADGVTGEKGLSGYSTIFPQLFSSLLGRFAHLDSNFLKDLYAQHPIIHKTFRFHIDTWCLDKYYPRVGDCGHFASRVERYAGAGFVKPASTTEPSMYSLFWKLYELTNDTDFVKVLYKANDSAFEDLPHDIFSADPEQFQKNVKRIIDKEGDVLKVGDVNLTQWGIAVLRSGEKELKRAFWVAYHPSGSHRHNDGLTLGLFAKKLDLLPDFGYPPVGYGGWSAPKAVWYAKTAAHNTVTVDGKNHLPKNGNTAFWGAGKYFDMIKVSGAEMIDGKKYDRAIAKIDISDEDFYLIDIFDVIGGKDHALFFNSAFSSGIETQGLNLTNPTEYGYQTETRNFKADKSPEPGWSIDWKIAEEKDGEMIPTDIHLKYTGLTENAEASLGECWIDFSNRFGGKSLWIPRLMIRRQSKDAAPLASQFIGILEPYEKQEFIHRIFSFHIPDKPQSRGIGVELKDGGKQYFCFPAIDNIRTNVDTRTIRIKSDAEFIFISKRDEWIESAVICNGSSLEFEKLKINLKEKTDFLELRRADKEMEVVTGNKDSIESILFTGFDSLIP